jgi:uncharacterized membrane protein YjgN (DUF898 family)
MTAASNMSDSNATPPDTNVGRGTFHGTGGQLFLVWLKNSILTSLTLGIYFAWARVRLYNYFYSNTEFAGNRFRFTGNGKEILKGMLRASGVLVGLVVVMSVLQLVSQSHPLLALIPNAGFYLAIIFLVQFAIFSAMRYRFSRARYREVAFHLEGNAWQFAREAMPKLLLSFVTLGLFYPYYSHWRTSKVYNNLRFGSLEFKWDAPAKEYWRLAVKGYLLSMVTFGIYYFFWYPKMFAFVRGHLSLAGNRFQGNIKSGELFGLFFTNALLAVCTFGIAAAWIRVRTLKFYLERLELENPAGLENAIQVGREKVSAGGEVIADAMDLGVGIGF